MLSQRQPRRSRFVSIAGGGLALSAAAVLVLAHPAFAASNPKPKGESLDGTPCTVTARVCVELDSRQAWLVQGGKIIRTARDISSGGDGEETPTGIFHVLSKDKDHKSKEYRIKSGPKKGQPAPMPWAVFFAPGGIAFHAGSPEVASAGCIHLEPADAVAWFNNLKVGDEVQVFQNSDDDDDDDSGSHHHHGHHDDDDK
ncbi:MAG TPA: L,D-transpeptidase [Pseudonocardia sp.]|jgi:hypothetical protein